ncbi:class F sortase [Streptomyces sp. KS 21]|uniref:class F sortase n=1 Tax=Streptomyces sp. KS 21 TaxID=2485150 RepID=UPI0010644854|nr:class F sortase [Streptomyces sp. KS 21]TDU77018.1 sortase (surface protein transpeptidase) [Streptomyces sp. KS 21]
MPRAKWVVGVLTVALLGTGIGMLRSTEGARPAAATAADALPSRALGLSGHRRLVEQLEHSGQHAAAKGPRPARAAAVTPLRASRPQRLHIPSLGVDLPLGGDGDEASWDQDTPAPGSAGTAVVTAADLRLGELRRGLTVEIARADGRTAVFTVDRVSPGVSGRGQRPGRAQLRLVSGETTVLARLTGRHRTR